MDKYRYLFITRFNIVGMANHYEVADINVVSPTEEAMKVLETKGELMVYQDTTSNKFLVDMEIFRATISPFNITTLTEIDDFIIKDKLTKFISE